MVVVVRNSRTHPNPTPAMTIDAFYLLISLFGGPPKVFFTDQGPEFTDVKGGVADTVRSHNSRFLQSPSQSPFTNPVERHNDIAKTYI